MAVDIRGSLAACEAFAGLPAVVLDELATHCALQALRGRDQLFEVGTPASAVYIVARGRLRAYRPGSTGGPWVHLGDIDKGELVGEISVFGGVPHTARVVAVRDTMLIHVPAEQLMALMHRQPDTWPTVTRTIVQRLVRSSTPHPREISTVCVRPLGAADARAVAEGLRAAFSKTVRCTRLGPADVVGLDDAALLALCDRAEDDNDVVILEASASDDVLDAWTRLCVRHADSVVDVIGPERPSAPIRDTWADDWQARDLLRIVDTSTPWSTSEVLATRGYRAVHHARPAAATDMERLARLLRGTAHGLVLSGGSAKGTAHIGVALALREAGLAPDFVTGTSAGALIGAMVASQWSEQQMRDAVYRLAAFPAWRELHPPFGSLLSGRQMRRLLVDLFGTTEVDETWLPFEPVAADLVSGAAVVPRSTTVRRAVQASTALPALWPPVPYGAQLLIDGGTVNNLPVDRAISPCGRGTITASDVATSVLSMSPTADELPTGWETLRARLSRRSLQGPALVDVLTRAGSLASATAQSRSSSAVTRRIAPDVEPPAGLSARAQVDWLIESGRAATQRVLDAEC